MREIGRDDKFELKVVGVVGCLFGSFNFRLHSIFGCLYCREGGGVLGRRRSR